MKNAWGAFEDWNLLLEPERPFQVAKKFGMAFLIKRFFFHRKIFQILVIKTLRLDLGRIIKAWIRIWIRCPCKVSGQCRAQIHSSISFELFKIYLVLLKIVVPLISDWHKHRLLIMDKTGSDLKNIFCPTTHEFLGHLFFLGKSNWFYTAVKL